MSFIQKKFVQVGGGGLFQNVVTSLFKRFKVVIPTKVLLMLPVVCERQLIQYIRSYPPCLEALTSDCLEEE
jgi:hypothetical protein